MQKKLKNFNAILNILFGKDPSIQRDLVNNNRARVGTDRAQVKPIHSSA